MHRRTVLLIGVVAAGVVLGGAGVLHYVVFQPGIGTSGSTLSVSEPQTNYTGDGSVIAYGELTPEQRRVFERALENDSVSVSIPNDVNSTVWIENRAVRYRNRTYTVAVGKG